MPELPEVENAARRLREAAVGKTIARVRLLHPSARRRLPARRAAQLAGRRITAIERRGKHQLIHLDDRSTIVAHFRLNGDWEIGRVEHPELRHTRAAIELADGTRVALVDSRALSSVEWHPPDRLLLPPLGPEPFDEAFTPATLGASLARRRGPIKPALLDQRVVAGLGNIYAAEALWRARISPRARAASLSLTRRARLVRAIRAVLDRAPAGRYWIGGREARWQVYDREGERCRRCGARIRRLAQGGRSTYYCPRCQRI